MVRARVGAVLPHAPLLVPQVSGLRAEPGIEKVRAAVREVARDLGRSTVVLSPHGMGTGVYAGGRADLSSFGAPRADARVSAPDDVVRELAETWGKPVLDGPPDHGVAVPVLLGPLAPPVIGVAFAEGADPTSDAASLADALSRSDHDVVASVNSGAGVTPRAPLTELNGAVALERDLADALGSDPAGVGDVAHALASDGGSCCLGPLLVLAELFSGGSAELLAHEWPFGVGYVVARLRAQS